MFSDTCYKCTFWGDLSLLPFGICLYTPPPSLGYIQLQVYGQRLNGWYLRRNLFINYKFLMYSLNGSIFIYLKFILNWRKIALQCCVHFCHTITWISHKYIYPLPLEPPTTPPPHPIIFSFDLVPDVLVQRTWLYPSGESVHFVNDSKI